MLSDIEIAQATEMDPISEVAASLGIPQEALEPYGHYKAKVSLDYLNSLKDRPDGKLILVTAISPTPAGEGKTTTTVGLGDALNRIGKRTVIALREPSLGPVFGMKGGATGGGRRKKSGGEKVGAGIRSHSRPCRGSPPCSRWACIRRSSGQSSTPSSHSICMTRRCWPAPGWSRRALTSQSSSGRSSQAGYRSNSPRSASS